MHINFVSNISYWSINKIDLGLCKMIVANWESRGVFLSSCDTTIVTNLVHLRNRSRPLGEIGQRSSGTDHLLWQMPCTDWLTGWRASIRQNERDVIENYFKINVTTVYCRGIFVDYIVKSNYFMKKRYFFTFKIILESLTN